jgi:prepilin-type N-terminal cleavage/methylation domain-containing protein/prepilin-type processing-associated H-X9-DG protein
MTNARRYRPGFTLMELSVVSAIVGMAFMLGAPALDKGRDGVHRRRCEDNLRQLSMAMLAYADANGGLPPMAMSFDEAHKNANQPGPGGWYDGHGWYSFVGPYIGEPAWAATINFTRSMTDVTNFQARRGGLRLKIHACPADIGLTKNEWNSPQWARVHSNYVVNAGNTNYGQTPINEVPFLGAPFTAVFNTPLASITDGTANTLMMSEIRVLPATAAWLGAYSETQCAIGGQVFTGSNPPNTRIPDNILYGPGPMNAFFAAGISYPTNDVTIPVTWTPQDTRFSVHIAPRSKHDGGINASHCDGSVTFYADGIDLAVWRALSTAQGADAPIAAATKPVRRTK